MDASGFCYISTFKKLIYLSKSTYLNANGFLLHRYFKKNLLNKSMYLDANGFHYIGTSKKDTNFFE
jgi:hypothetical protein